MDRIMVRNVGDEDASLVYRHVDGREDRLSLHPGVTWEIDISLAGVGWPAPSSDELEIDATRTEVRIGEYGEVGEVTQFAGWMGTVSWACTYRRRGWVWAIRQQSQGAVVDRTTPA